MEHYVLLLMLYLIETVPIFVIANKCGHEYAWTAFVPFVNLWLLCDLADVNWMLIILVFFPFINIVFLGVIWWRIAENTNKPGWVGLLMLVPLLNLAVGFYMAFADNGRFNA